MMENDDEHGTDVSGTVGEQQSSEPTPSISAVWRKSQLFAPDDRRGGKAMGLLIRRPWRTTF
jgi:hypothetical protein